MPQQPLDLGHGSEFASKGYYAWKLGGAHRTMCRCSHYNKVSQGIVVDSTGLYGVTSTTRRDDDSAGKASTTTTRQERSHIASPPGLLPRRHSFLASASPSSTRPDDRSPPQRIQRSLLPYTATGPTQLLQGGNNCLSATPAHDQLHQQEPHQFMSDAPSTEAYNEAQCLENGCFSSSPPLGPSNHVAVHVNDDDIALLLSLNRPTIPVTEEDPSHGIPFAARLDHVAKSSADPVLPPRPRIRRVQTTVCNGFDTAGLEDVVCLVCGGLGTEFSAIRWHGNIRIQAPDCNGFRNRLIRDDNDRLLRELCCLRCKAMKAKLRVLAKSEPNIQSKLEIMNRDKSALQLYSALRAMEAESLKIQVSLWRIEAERWKAAIQRFECDECMVEISHTENIRFKIMMQDSTTAAMARDFLQVQILTRQIWMVQKRRLAQLQAAMSATLAKQVALRMGMKSASRDKAKSTDLDDSEMAEGASPPGGGEGTTASIGSSPEDLARYFLTLTNEGLRDQINCVDNIQIQGVNNMVKVQLREQVFQLYGLPVPMDISQGAARKRAEQAGQPRRSRGGS